MSENTINESPADRIELWERTGWRRVLDWATAKPQNRRRLYLETDDCGHTECAQRRAMIRRELEKLGFRLVDRDVTRP